MSDELWNHFQPLWNDLREVSPTLLLAGGYGLFLKQKWLGSFFNGSIAEERVPTVVGFDRWIGTTPRVTKDFDLIPELNLLASTELQKRTDQVLRKHGFAPVPGNERWEFKKEIAGDRNVLVDFHTPAPTLTRRDLKVEQRRIKPRPSIGVGIHARRCPEAVGCELSPFSFQLEGSLIVVPNPVTWAGMKIVAMRDRWETAQDPQNDPRRRNYFLEQAAKHAQDTFRIVAMMTRGENDRTSSVLQSIRPAMTNLALPSICKQYFGDATSFGSVVTRDYWEPSSIDLIRSILGDWFG